MRFRCEKCNSVRDTRPKVASIKTVTLDDSIVGCGTRPASACLKLRNARYVNTTPVSSNYPYKVCFCRSVKLVNRENFFLFTPMLHEVAASDLDLTAIVNPGTGNNIFIDNAVALMS
jgi:hypothetical protein